MADGEKPRPGGQFKTWHGCIIEDHRGLRATEGSTELASLVFGVEPALWSTTIKKAGKWWYRGVLEERFMVRWHEAEAELSRQRRASAVYCSKKGGEEVTGGSLEQPNASWWGGTRMRHS